MSLIDQAGVNPHFNPRAEEEAYRPVPGLLDSRRIVVDQHKPGAKLDAGKVRMALVLNGFAPALLEVAKVGTFGANKYSDNGWLSVPNGYARYNDAQLRHGFAHASGELYDEESKLLHLAHEAWNALAKLTLHLNATTPKV